MSPLPRSVFWSCWLALAVLAALPLVADPFTLRLVTRILIYALFALSLDLLVGVAGLVSLGHAAFWGLGGYITASLINFAGVENPLLLALAAVAGCAGVALPLGALSLRTRGVGFLMITLALAQMLRALFHDLPFWGGSDGINLISRPQMTFAGGNLDFSHRPTLYAVALCALTIALLGLRYLTQTPFGQILRGIRSNEARLRALGYDTRFHALSVFVLAGSLAGLAGFLEACRTAFVSPAHLGWHESGQALATVILGGLGTLVGPVLGAFTLVLLEDRVSDLTAHGLLLLGGLIMAMVLFLPRGLAGLLSSRLVAVAPMATGVAKPESSLCSPLLFPEPEISRAGNPDPPGLEVRRLSRSFGGLRAVADVSLVFAPGRIHAILGPNGAGKTTLINLLSGELAPSAGSIHCAGQTITPWSAPARTRLGLGRSYQKTNLFPELSCWENCRLGAQAGLSAPSTPWRPVTALPDLTRRTAEALAVCGLESLAAQPVAALSHGARRQLELAMVLATGAKLLLLDEPLAGMGSGESLEMIALIRRLARGTTVILIEHDLDAVFALADTLTVMVNGRVLETGDVDTVRTSPAVREAYLGYR